MEEIEPVYGCGNCPYSDVGYWDGVSGQWGIDCFYGAKDNMTPRRAYTNKDIGYFELNLSFAPDCPLPVEYRIDYQTWKKTHDK